MRPGTKAILEHLKRSRSVRFIRQDWADLVEDILALGREQFLRVAVDHRAEGRSTRKSQKHVRASDPLLKQMDRYRKKSGLNVRAFIAALHTKLEGRLNEPPSKAIMTSGPKYLSYIRQSLNAEEIEAGFAAVLADYA